MFIGIGSPIDSSSMIFFWLLTSLDENEFSKGVNHLANFLSSKEKISGF